MTYLERMVRRARVKMKMIGDGRVYHPLKGEIEDMVVDSLRIRFSQFTYNETAIVRSLNYVSEDERTIDDILLCESASFD